MVSQWCHRSIVFRKGVRPALCALVCAGMFSTGSALAGTGIPPLATTRVASGLSSPVFATHAPGDFERLFIIEQAGRIRILNLVTGVLSATPFLNIVGIVDDVSNEQGLLGLAFHPDYAPTRTGSAASSCCRFCTWTTRPIVWRWAWPSVCL